MKLALLKKKTMIYGEKNPTKMLGKKPFIPINYI